MEYWMMGEGVAGSGRNKSLERFLTSNEPLAASIRQNVDLSDSVAIKKAVDEKLAGAENKGLLALAAELSAGIMPAFADQYAVLLNGAALDVGLLPQENLEKILEMIIQTGAVGNNGIMHHWVAEAVFDNLSPAKRRENQRAIAKVLGAVRLPDAGKPEEKREHAYRLLAFHADLMA